MNEKTGVKDLLGIAARFIVGGVFIYAGWLKAVAPAASLTIFIALVVPWLEIYLGLFLITGVFTAYSALCLGATLLGFEGLLLQAIIRKLPVTSCGCFGASKSGSLSHEFIQNLVIL